MICFELSKVLHPIENVATGNDLLHYHIQGVLLVTINEYYLKKKVMRVACVWLISFRVF